MFNASKPFCLPTTGIIFGEFPASNLVEQSAKTPCVGGAYTDATTAGYTDGIVSKIRIGFVNNASRTFLCT